VAVRRPPKRGEERGKEEEEEGEEEEVKEEEEEESAARAGRRSRSARFGGSISIQTRFASKLINLNLHTVLCTAPVLYHIL
jgi:hypothetical protein